MDDKGQQPRDRDRGDERKSRIPHQHRQEQNADLNGHWQEGTCKFVLLPAARLRQLQQQMKRRENCHQGKIANAADDKIGDVRRHEAQRREEHDRECRKIEHYDHTVPAAKAPDEGKRRNGHQNQHTEHGRCYLGPEKAHAQRCEGHVADTVPVHCRPEGLARHDLLACGLRHRLLQGDIELEETREYAGIDFA